MFFIRFFVLFFILVGSNSSWATKISFRHLIEKDLPQELTKLSYKTTKQELVNTFKNKISLSEKDTLYIDYFKKSNDVTIGLTKDHFEYILISPPLNQIKEPELFKKVYSSLSDEEKKHLEKPMNLKTHDEGRYITVKLPREYMTLKFINNEEKTLVSILLRPKKKTGP